jgi:hypothetical protein
MSAFRQQVGRRHYKSLAIQPVEYTRNALGLIEAVGRQVRHPLATERRDQEVAEGVTC